MPFFNVPDLTGFTVYKINIFPFFLIIVRNIVIALIFVIKKSLNHMSQSIPPKSKKNNWNMFLS